jgi:hypothetical protein
MMTQACCYINIIIGMMYYMKTPQHNHFMFCNMYQPSTKKSNAKNEIKIVAHCPTFNQYTNPNCWVLHQSLSLTMRIAKKYE